MTLARALSQAGKGPRFPVIIALQPKLAAPREWA